MEWERLIREEGARYFVGLVIAGLGVVVVAAFEGVPWTFRIPAALVTICALLWLLDRYRGQGIAGLFKLAKSPAPALVGVEPGVRFDLPGWWETPITKIGLGGDKHAEQLVLRLTATRNLQNVRVQIRLLDDEAGTRVEVTRFTVADEFAGSVPKGLRKDIVVLNRAYEMVEARFENKIMLARKEAGLTFFPYSSASVSSDAYDTYILVVEAFHDEGPDAGSFTIKTGIENRPLTMVEGRHNVGLITEQR